MSLNAGVLTFKEFAMREQLPLATIHQAVLEFLRGRDDVVVFGASGQRLCKRTTDEPGHRFGFHSCDPVS